MFRGTIIIGDSMKILCIGHAAYDITMPLDRFPIENTKNRVPELVECGGGPSSNGAYLLGKWGMDVHFAGIVGKDLYGERIKQEFDTIGVDTTYLEMSEEHETTSSFIIANKSIGSRTVLTYRPSDMKMTPVDLDFTPDIILFDGQEAELTRTYLERYPNAISIIDAGRPRPEIVELAKLSTYVVCSKEFAETVTGVSINYENQQTLIDLFLKMEQMFSGEIVVTLESKGCLYKENGQIKLMPTIKVKALDSTGAGDIFHGAFTYGIANRFPYEDVIKIATIAGGLSVTKIGGRYSVPSKEEMKEMFHDFR